MKTHPVPKAGDTVVLNDHGLKQIYGTTIGLSAVKSMKMKITNVERQSITAPELTFGVSVDNPEIDMFLIDHWHFDVVKP